MSNPAAAGCHTFTLYLFHLQIIYFYGGFSAEHRYQNFNLAFLLRLWRLSPLQNP